MPQCEDHCRRLRNGNAEAAVVDARRLHEGRSLRHLREDGSGTLTVELPAEALDVVLAELERVGARLPVAATRSGLATRLRHYVGQNFRDECMSPQRAAADLGRSLRSVHKACQNMGTTFGRLLLEARLSAAAQVLACNRTPQARISDVAFDSGCSDISHLCKVFRVRFGLSPTEFRRQRQ